MGTQIRRPFEKFVDSHYFESEICADAVMVLFRSTPLGKRCNSYNALTTSRKCAADSFSQDSEGYWNRQF